MGRNHTKDYGSVASPSQSLGSRGHPGAFRTSRTKSVLGLGASEDGLPRLVAEQVHNMSQPLTALQGTVELALLSEHTAGGYRAALEESLKQLTRLNDIVSSLRDLADAHAQNAGSKSRVLSISVNRGPFEKATLTLEVPGRVRPRKKSVSSPSVSTERNSELHRDPQSITERS